MLTWNPRPWTLADQLPGDLELRILHADADVLVIAKPSGLLSVPGRGANLADCVAARAQVRFPGAVIVHRLDKDTSGVMVMARNAAAHRALGRQFERRLIGKVYIARVAGVMEENSGLVDAPLAADWPNRPRQMIDRDGGRAALTAWQVIAREAGATRVRLSPETGRSHQLRVHMLSIGHPILGDNLYADAAARDAAGRLQLHALSLGFQHPRSGEHLNFEDGCPF